MTDSANPLQDLITNITNQTATATEVLTKLGSLITSSDAVTFNLPSGAVSVPSIPQIQASSLGQNINSRVASVEALSRGLVQSVDRLTNSVTSLQSASNGGANIPTASPFWTSLDLSTATASGLTTDPFYRCEVDQSIRLPFDGYTVSALDRQFTSSSSKLGDFILPTYTEVLDTRYTSTPAYSQYVNVNAYSINGPSRAVTTYITYPYYYYYYGYYYRWYLYWYYPYYYYGYWYYGTYTVASTKIVQTTLNLTGSMTAQTFQVPQPIVMTGLKLLASYVADYRVAANPRLHIVDTSYGRPDMSKVKATATLNIDTETAKSGATVSTLTWVLSKPVPMKPGTSYGLVIETNGDFRVLYTANQDATGGVFYTQDRQDWEADLTKDLAYSIIYADFGAGNTLLYIPVPPVQLSGGIASAKATIAGELPTGTTVGVQIQLNSAWYDIDYLNSIASLPPYTAARLKLTGTQYNFAPIDSVNSNVTAFRPATSGEFISVDQAAAQSLNIAYELIGFNGTFHTFDPALKVGSTRYTPTATSSAVSTDGNVKTVTASYTLPTSTAYRHDIKLVTLNASQTFDVRSVIKFNN